MHLTKFTDYALRVLMYLAQRQGKQVTIAEIARAHGVSESHLMKVVNRLARLGYLTTVRGKGGGIGLGRPAAGISVGAVIRDLEPVAMVECLESDYQGNCRLSPRCGLQRVLHDAQENFLAGLDRHMLTEISGLGRARDMATAVSRSPRLPP
jgi:Rrf2 family nitric oxide-sensitive transcriptional repressor